VEYLFAKEANGSLNLSAADYDGPFYFNRRAYPQNPADLFGSAPPQSVSSALFNAQHLNKYFPTQFAGAYRPQLSSVFHPEVMPLSAPPPPVLNEAVASNQLRSRHGIESTVLRSAGPGPRNQPAPRDLAPHFSPAPALQASFNPAISSIQPIPSDVNRNAFTRYQRMMRLPNLVTDQSNVFAVWVTVSLFEYDPVTGFGREYVNASGEEKRERAFYIIDRTVPVGLIPGEDLNTEKTIMLRRKISGDR
jgi:hypothetical protein